MTRRTQIEWREFIRQQQESGLSAAEFCRQTGQNENYFSLQKTKLRKLDSPFIAVKKSPSLDAPSHSTLRLTYANAMLDVPLSVAPGWVAQLLKELT